MDTTTTIKKLRKHYAAIRTINRNLRLRRYDGRNSAATEAGLQYHQRQADALLSQLSHPLQGKLWSEHDLAGRISENRDLGNQRPELRARLSQVRREIKELS